MAIRAILSDIGNVVAFFDNSRTIKGLRWYSDLHDSEIDRCLFGRPDGLMWRYARGEIDTETFRSLVHDEVGLFPPMSPLVFATVFSRVFTPNLEVVPLWGRLRKRDGLIITAVSDIEPLRHEELEDMGIMALFDHTVLSYEEKICKPSEELIVTALDRSGVKAEEAVFIDDIAANLAPAIALGVVCHHYRDYRGLRLFLHRNGVLAP